MWKWLRWVLLGLILILIGGFLFVWFYMPLSFYPTIDGDNPPKFIQADFVQLDKIYSISKYRSGVGHDYSDSDETCRSMKHYFSSMNPNMPNYKMQKLKEIDYPKPQEGKDVTIFSPTDGKILRIDHQKNRGWIGDEIKIVPDSYPKVIIRLMHVTPINNSIKSGKKVYAGEKVGLVLANQSFDIAIDQNTVFNSQNISYFAVMPDSIFAMYQKRGVKSRDDLIITKEYRDAHPFKCVSNTKEFEKNYADGPEGDAENMVHLSGYDEINSVIQQQWSQSVQEKERK